MSNEEFISQELDWLCGIISFRVRNYFRQETAIDDIHGLTPPDAALSDGAYARFILENKFSFEDRVYLSLMTAPVLKPQIMDFFNVRNSDTGQRFVEFGCVESGSGTGLLPSLETVLFLLTGGDVAEKIRLTRYFLGHPVFNGSLFVKDTRRNEVNYILAPGREFIDTRLYERKYDPSYSSEFPARLLRTDRPWSDLVLDVRTMDQIGEIKLWLDFGDKLLNDWGMRGKIKKGYRALFDGPPGTGKTFTAALLGNHVGRDVFCVDLSLVVSKYIGETEKNLSGIFALAESKDWILFFDEADALFGKRTNIKDAHDRYANQEIAYLLQRVEDYDGLVILSSNLKSNIDEAFARRFQSVIRFPMPNPANREKLWRASFPPKAILDSSLNLKEIAEKHELSGGSIMNVVQYCCLKSLSRGNDLISPADLAEGIRKEFRKEGKITD